MLKWENRRSTYQNQNPWHTTHIEHEIELVIIVVVYYFY